MNRLRCDLVTKRFSNDVPALADASFAVNGGEALVVIGRNGAGKTTLLRVIAGITLPDEGSIERPDRTAAVIELGAGLAPDLTGRENLEIGLVMAGVGRRLRAARSAAIKDLGPIADALDTPVKRWSTGMVARLSFTIAFRSEPDLLLVDEVLAVGDTVFQRAVAARSHALVASGGILVITTHDLRLARAIGDRALWLDGGAVRDFGPVDAVVDAYEAEVCGVGAWRDDPRVALTELTIETKDVQPGGSLTARGTLELRQPVDGLGIRLDVRPRVGDAPWERSAEETPMIREMTTCARTPPEPLGDLRPGTYHVSAFIDVLPVASADVSVSLVLVDLSSSAMLDEVAVGVRIGSRPGFPGHHLGLEDLEAMPPPDKP